MSKRPTRDAKPAKRKSKTAPARAVRRAKSKTTTARRKSAARRAPQVRGALQPRGIDAALKGAVLAAEPPTNADRNALDGTFRTRLDAALAQLNAQGQPFKFVEGFRTTDRQQWLFGSGRPTVVPHGRPGPIVTNADGVRKLSNHQGTGTAGSGKAADCYPMKNGKVFIPPNTDPLWSAYAAAVVAQGLTAGHNFKTFKDSPHCELT